MREGGDEVGGAAGKSVGAVELAGVETERVAAGGRVARDAIGATGEAPRLRARDAVAAGGGFHEETRLEAAGGGGLAAGEFEVEVFDPDRAGGEGSRGVGGESETRRGVGEREPATLRGVIRPEGDIGLVGDDAGRGPEGSEIGEGARGGEGEGKRIAAGSRGRNEALDHAFGEIDGEHIAGGGIEADGDGAVVRGELLHAIGGDGCGRIGGIGRERPDEAAD